MLFLQKTEDSLHLSLDSFAAKYTGILQPHLPRNTSELHARYVEIISSSKKVCEDIQSEIV